MSTGYTVLKVPSDVMEDVDLLIQTGGLGYRSRTEFAVDAIRRHVQFSDDAIQRREARRHAVETQKDYLQLLREREAKASGDED